MDDESGGTPSQLVLILAYIVTVSLPAIAMAPHTRKERKRQSAKGYAAE